MAVSMDANAIANAAPSRSAVAISFMIFGSHGLLVPPWCLAIVASPPLPYHHPGPFSTSRDPGKS